MRKKFRGSRFTYCRTMSHNQHIPSPKKSVNKTKKNMYIYKTNGQVKNKTPKFRLKQETHCMRLDISQSLHNFI